MRFPSLTRQDMTALQQEVAARIVPQSGSTATGVDAALLYSPDVAELMSRLGEYLRFNLRLPERLRVLALLVTAARHDAADAGLFVDLPEVKNSGLASSKIAAIASGQRPSDLDRDETLIHEAVLELNAIGRVKQATFDRLIERFDHQICIELITTCGYTACLTTLLAITQRSLQEDIVET